MKLNKLPLNVIGLNRVGLNQIGSPSRRANTSDRPYIDPEVLASLVAVCICDGKSNNDPDRAVIKNLVDPDNPFVISNAAYKLNSGYGKYEEDFTSWSRLIGVKAFSNKFVIENKAFNCAYYVRDTGEDLDEFKAKINNHTDGIIRYTYINQDGIVANLDISPDDSNRVFTFPKSYNSIEGVANHICGFQTPMFVNTGIIIEQIPSHQGAFVTDGKDDLIASTKTVKEMLGGSNEVTVVSMVHQIGLSSLTTINNIRSESVAHVVCRNVCSSAGKTGIYGYSRQINADNYPTLINNILGDKKDYTAEGNSALDPTDKFFVQGYKYRGTISEVSPIAYYWTFIANKVLTTDQINQVISYFNLDKHVKPDVYYDVKKQGLSNDTPEADWYLKDFSGNGHDMQLYNFAKKLGSGIGKYEADYSTWIKTEGVISTPFGLKITEPTHNYWILYTSNITVPAHKVKILGIPEGGEFRYLGVHILKNGINELPKMEEHPSAIGFTLHRGTTQPSDWVGLSVEQIPDYEGALVSDGIDDYGYADNLPIYKDYTVVADYARLKYGVIDSAIVSKSYIVNNGAFAFNLASGISPKNVSVISFGVGSPQIQNDDNYKKIRYQSKYINDSVNISAGTGIDSDKLWISCLRENKAFSESALYSILLFPYTLSEFLLERQLKRYKLGTLYPDMVEFRPIVKSNRGYSSISYSVNPGEYISVDSMVTITVTLSNTSDKLIDVSCNAISDISISGDNGVYKITGKIVKSPQKIGITIDEYIRYEDIVQPYPAIINLKQDGKTITWGDKLKVGSDIVFVGSANLLPELYTVSETRYNGVTLYPNTIIKVEKSMVFDNARTYLKANEPSCILSPNRLRIPNSSYKILGYIPDLTGKGNHGRLNNFAYAGMSGANGYIEPFNDNKWHISSSANKINRTDNKITVISLKANRGIIYVGAGTYINEIKVIATGIPVGGELIFHQDTDITIPNNVIVTIGGKISTGSWEFIVNDLTLDWSNLVIEQLGQYEGSFCLDGVDDHITIPTLAHGSKCMLMKVNWNKDALMLYDQRSDDNPNSFAIYIPNFNNNEDSIAYSSIIVFITIEQPKLIRNIRV